MISSRMRTEELLQELKRSNAELEAQAGELERESETARGQEPGSRAGLAEASRKKPSSSSSSRSTSRSSWRTCRTSCERRSTACSSFRKCCRRTRTATSRRSRSSSRRPSSPRATICWASSTRSWISPRSRPARCRSIRKRSGCPTCSDYVEQTFRHVAEQKGLGFEIKIGRDAAAERCSPTPTGCKQILKNLLSNAFKFTEQGQVELLDPRRGSGRKLPRSTSLNPSQNVIAFAVRDTGIGIPRDKQNLIFEAFQQADGTTSRKYGGTGLGLTISREIARLLGGWIEVKSAPGEGSTFTLYPARRTTRAPRPAQAADREPIGDREQSSTFRRSRRTPTSRARRFSSWTTTSETSSPSTACSSRAR